MQANPGWPLTTVSMMSLFVRNYWESTKGMDLAVFGEARTLDTSGTVPSPTEFYGFYTSTLQGIMPDYT